MYHGVLDKAYVVDLGSAHGTFWDSRKIEPNQPMPLPRMSAWASSIPVFAWNSKY